MDTTQDTVANQVPQAFSLGGVRVIEFGHMVMGPTGSMTLIGLPYIGEHGKDVFREVSYTIAGIKSLRASRALLDPG